MKNPQDQTNKELIKWILKTSDSIQSESKRNGFKFSERLGELVNRHFWIAEEMKSRGIWECFCNENGLCKTHNGSDCAA